MTAPAPRLQFIQPDWPAPAHVQALTTTRAGGVSAGGYSALNLATHVADDAACVARNRKRLSAAAQLPAEPCWLNQVHGAAGVVAGAARATPVADWSWSATAGVVCAILTADCLPVLMTDRAGSLVAAVHAGWRGLAGGVLGAAAACFAHHNVASADVLAWFGPAIGAASYEVDAPVREGILAASAACAPAFTPTRPGHWQLDLVVAARALLGAAGITHVFGGEYCTFSDEQFFSHRREAPCGRQASLIWIGQAPMVSGNDSV